MAECLNVAIIGCGLIGKRRAAVAAAHHASRVVWMIDADAAIAADVAGQYTARSATEWQIAVDDPDVDVICAATPNHLLAPIAIAAIRAGKHVLLEKPMGRDLAEARAIARAAAENTRVKVKIGFNHRYHPGIGGAYEQFRNGRIGSIINMRVRYGHGGRPGYEDEWRGRRETAGGGELTDQGVHVADLIAWFAGLPDAAFAMLQTAVWPLGDLEDNAFGIFRYNNGCIVNLHTSWTQWKNLFSFEVFGDRGSLCVEGLGKSYGIERLIIAERALEGGAPAMTEQQFDQDDTSWQREWTQFVAAITQGAAYTGDPADGLNAMTMIDALYRSAASGGIVEIAKFSD